MVDETETFAGSLEDVRAFCAVVEFGSVSAAALRLGVSKGGVSRRLSRLEERLGTLLLARTPRSVTATEEGLAFYASAREALTWLDDAADVIRQSHAEPRGHLRVTAPVDFGIDVLPELVVRFRALHPQITVELLITDTPLDLAAGRIDLALRARVGDLPDMRYRASRVATMRHRLYAAPAYLAARGGPPARTAQLAEHDLVLAREPEGAVQLTLSDRRGRSETVTARPALRSSDYSSALRMLLAGGGIGAIPDLIAAPVVATGALVPVLPNWKLLEAVLYGISLAGRNAPARVRIFREFVRRELGALDG